MKPYPFARVPKLYAALEERFNRGVFPVLEHIEAHGSNEVWEAVVSCMNAAFEAGQVEMLRKERT